MEKPDFNKIFSLQFFLRDLYEGLKGPEISWTFKIDAHQKGDVISFSILIPLNLFGDRKEWLMKRITDVSMKHGLHLYTDWKTADFCLSGTFADIQAIRI